MRQRFLPEKYFPVHAASAPGLRSPARYGASSPSWYPVLGKVGEHSVVRLPAVGKLGADSEVDRLVGGVGIEQVGYSRAGHDDAGVPVAGCQHAQAACFQMEGRRVAPSG